MAKRKIYRVSDPPCLGGQYIMANNDLDAITKTEQLNKKAKKKDWVWC